MRVVGTAGHVDHGKSTLVHALTNIDPDRLLEEKQRGMTIDLGFAWIDLPAGARDGDVITVGIVDVPGHIDFIKNMLAGVGGIDAAILVIAADEGVMPQTREHLAILDLLAVPAGVVALTKIDTVEDPEWLDLVELDIHDILASTHLRGAPVVRVSAVTGQGLDEFRAVLAGLLADLPARRDRAQPRLPIDRAFTLSGFGTIVTGTLSDGALAVGETVEVLPAGLTGRIRGMQSHHHRVESSVPGSRVALNLTGISQDSLHRGDVVVRPGTHSPTSLLDTSFRLLPDVAKALKHNALVDFFVGSSETRARVRLLGSDRLDAGAEGWLQLRLESPVVVAPGDRYILRQPSPSATLGGGVVLDAHPRRRWRRFDDRVLARLAVLESGSPDEILLQALERTPFLSSSELWAASGLDLATAQQSEAALRQSGAIVSIGHDEAALLTARAWQDANARLVKEVSEYHRRFPLRKGIPRGELRSRLDSVATGPVTLRLFNAWIDAAVRANVVGADDNLVWTGNFVVELTAAQSAAVERVESALAKAGSSPPSIAELLTLLNGETELLEKLIEDGRLVRVGSDLLYRRADFDQLVSAAVAAVESNGSISLADARDLWRTSRRYAQAVLEEMDSRRITRRAGDVRILR